MNDYEILLMLDPELAEERQNEIIARTRELVEQGGGAWLSHDPWGRRRLAYEIDHKTDGVYHLLQFDAEPVTLDEIARVLKITDGVMRHMATRRPQGGGRTAPPPQVEVEPPAARSAPAPAEADVEKEPAEEYAGATESEPASEGGA